MLKVGFFMNLFLPNFYLLKGRIFFKGYTRVIWSLFDNFHLIEMHLCMVFFIFRNSVYAALGRSGDSGSPARSGRPKVSIVKEDHLLENPCKTDDWQN